MKDFTLQQYRNYLTAIRLQQLPFLRFDEFMQLQKKPDRFCLIRHDVDRKPQNALKMATLEHAMGIKATYYFRIKPKTFKPDIIKQIEAMGHEVGYHYESLSDTNGDIKAALADFEKNLSYFRALTPIRTIAMHGRPLKPYDNRDMWKIRENHDLLKLKFGLLGEIYLDIDYSDIAYINDTGRNWTSSKSNRRDKVNSEIKADFTNGNELLEYLQSNPHPKIVFQIHPERWSDNQIEYCVQWVNDTVVNMAKFLLAR